MLEGCDVSHWQSPSQQLGSFVIPKATQSCNFKDPAFQQHIAYALSHGRVAKEGYHFLTPDFTGAAQADYYMAVSPGPLHILDWETNPDGRKPSQATAQAFLDRGKAHGRITVTYALPSDTLKVTTDIRWPAQLSTSPPSIVRHGDLWQYAWSPIDKDRFNGTLAECKSLFYGTPTPTPTPIPTPTPTPEEDEFMPAMTPAQQEVMAFWFGKERATNGGNRPLEYIGSDGKKYTVAAQRGFDIAVAEASHMGIKLPPPVVA